MLSNSMMMLLLGIGFASADTLNVASIPSNADVNPVEVVGNRMKSQEPDETPTPMALAYLQEDGLREEPTPHSRMPKDSVLAKQGEHSTALDALIHSYGVWKQIFGLVSQDPVVLSASVLLIAYLGASLAMGKKPQPQLSQGKGYANKQRAPRQYPRDFSTPADRQMSWRAEAKPISAPPGLDAPDRQPPKRAAPKRGKSQIAIQVNQQLLRLDTTSEVLDCALAYTGQTDIVNIVTAIHRCAKLGGRNRKEAATDPRLVQLLDQLEEFFQQDQPTNILTRAVGNTSWALAKIQFTGGESSHPILDTLQKMFSKHCKVFKPEELMNTVWAFAELRRESREGQYRALEVAKGTVQYVERFNEFTLQQVVYFAWALGRLSGITSVRSDAEVRKGLSEYTDLIVGRLHGGVRSLTAKNLAMTAWGVAHLEIKLNSSTDIRGLLTAIGDEAVRRGLPGFGCGDLASIVWALNKAHQPHEEFYGKFREQLLAQGFVDYSNQDAANVISIYVVRAFNDKDSDLLKLLHSTAEKYASSFSRVEKSSVHWAFSQVDYPMPAGIA